ncbi:MAG: hypothetical protein WCH04_04380, partial [Gammaproteobacteria bacterium]
TRLLQITQGNVTRAAGIAKRNRTEFYKLLQRHHLNPSQFKAAHPESNVNDHAQRGSGSDGSSH